MSRGLGELQRFVLDFLAGYEEREPSTPCSMVNLADARKHERSNPDAVLAWSLYMFGRLPRATESMQESVRRATDGLESRSLVVSTRGSRGGYRTGVALTDAGRSRATSRFRPATVLRLSAT